MGSIELIWLSRGKVHAEDIDSEQEDDASRFLGVHINIVRNVPAMFSGCEHILKF